MSSLDNKQKLAVTSKSDYILCNSKAGSGKTTTLMSRVVELLKNGAKPEEILMVTFTNKAAQEMTERLRRVSPESHKILCGTFHGLGLIFLKKYHLELEYEKFFTVLSPDDAEKIFKEIYSVFEKAGRLYDFETKKITPKRIMQEYSTSRNLNQRFRDYLEDKNYILGDIPKILEIVKTFEERKLFNDLVDFDDLLWHFNTLLSLPTVKEEVHKKYKYILADEFQDVNDVQFSIVEKLVPPNGKLFAVGDPYQCIYGFRGSKIEYIEGFKEYFNAEVVELDTNYRSTQEILDIGAELTSGKAKMIAHKGRGNQPEVFVADGNSQNEKIVNLVALKIRDLIESGEKASEIAVIIRSTNQIQLLEHQLKKLKINYVMRAGFSYFEKAHIKDILALLNTLANKNNKESLKRALGLFNGLGPATIDKIVKEYVSLGHNMEAVIKAGSTKKGLIEYNEVRKTLENMLSSARPISEMIEFIMKSFYNEHLKRVYDEDFDVRMSDIIALTKLSKGAVNLEDFINQVLIDTTINSKETNESKEYVVITTIHRAKGLEWDNVFILNLETLYRTPTYIEDDGDDFEVDEDSRLAYVAVTRARKRLEIYMCRNDLANRSKSRAHLTPVFAKLRRRAKYI